MLPIAVDDPMTSQKIAAMKTIAAARVTARGEVTIPAEVRRWLGLQQRGKVLSVIEEDGVRLEAPRSTLAHVFGSVEPLPGTSDDFDREIEAATAQEVDRFLE
jgi:bifunctional DNA-binding transcriptional regulator/antitoxin component of YhaV-PrlF toxin-antitoxin module